MNSRPFSGSWTTCSCSTTVPRLARFGAQHRRVADHRHLFSHVADSELEVEARFFAGRQADAVAPHGLEPRELDVDAVLARGEGRYGVDALAGGRDDPLRLGADRGDRDGRAGHGRAR